MNRQNVYEQWLRRQRKAGVSEDIADRVMTVLAQDSRPRPLSLRERQIVTPLAQAGLAAGALLVFLLRFAVLFGAAIG